MDTFHILLCFPLILLLAFRWLFMTDSHCSSTIPMESYGKFYSFLLTRAKTWLVKLYQLTSRNAASWIHIKPGALPHATKLGQRPKSNTNLTHIWQHVLYNLQCKTSFQCSAPCPHPSQKKKIKKVSRVRNKETLLAHNSTWVPSCEQKLNSNLHPFPQTRTWSEAKNLAFVTSYTGKSQELQVQGKHHTFLILNKLDAQNIMAIYTHYHFMI